MFEKYSDFKLTGCFMCNQTIEYYYATVTRETWFGIKSEKIEIFSTYPSGRWNCLELGEMICGDIDDLYEAFLAKKKICSISEYVISRFKGDK